MLPSKFCNRLATGCYTYLSVEPASAVSVTCFQPTRHGRRSSSIHNPSTVATLVKLGDQKVLMATVRVNNILPLLLLLMVWNGRDIGTTIHDEWECGGDIRHPVARLFHGSTNCFLQDLSWTKRFFEVCELHANKRCLYSRCHGP